MAMIVNNRFGVLDRIAGLYAKRCYNIDAISAGPTDEPGIHPAHHRVHGR